MRYQELPKPVDATLRKDEHLIWYGQPNSDILFVHSDWFLIPMFISVVTFCFLINSSFEGFAFLVLLILILMARMQMDRLRRRCTWYLVTDKRIAIRIQSAWERSTRSKEYTAEFVQTPMDGPQGTTTIYFGSEWRVVDFFFPPNYNYNYGFPRFCFLENANEIMAMIDEAKNQALLRQSKDHEM